MNILKRLTSLFSKKTAVVDNTTVDRVALLERNYLVLLKRVLEMDGIRLVSTKTSSLNSKVLQTPSDDNHKGLHEREPTIH